MYLLLLGYHKLYTAIITSHIQYLCMDYILSSKLFLYLTLYVFSKAFINNKFCWCGIITSNDNRK